MPQPVNLTVRYIHSATPVSFIQRGCFVHGFDDIPFQEITCRFSSSGKRRCTDRGIPSRYWQFHLRSATARKYRMRFPPFSGVSGIFQLLCVGLCTRKWWRSYSIVPGWRSVSLACRSLQLPGAAFRSQFQHPFRHTIYNGGRVIKHLITLATASQNGIPCSCQF